MWGKEYESIEEFILSRRRSETRIPPVWKEQVEEVRYPWIDLTELKKDGTKLWLGEESIYFIKVLLRLFEEWNEQDYNLIKPFLKQLQQEGIFNYDTELDGVKPTNILVVRGLGKQSPFNNARKLKGRIAEANSVKLYGNNDIIEKLIRNKRMVEDRREADLIIVGKADEYEWLRGEVKDWSNVIVIR